MKLTFHKSLHFLLTVLLVAGLTPLTGNAQGFTVRPFLWDVNAAPRDIGSQEIVINNQSGRLLRLYATVNEITVDSEGEVKEFVPPIESDRTTNVTSWLEITRGRINVEPGETVTVPLNLRVHPDAKPGEYHAFVGFYDTNKRFEAEAAALRGDTTGLPVKITLSEIRNSDVYVSAFTAPRFVTNPEETEITLEFTNNGELQESPSGELIFYSNRGQEVAAVDIVESEVIVESGGTAVLTKNVSLPDSIGRYSVSFSGQYGDTNKKPLIANTSFYVLPLWFVVLLVVTFVGLILLLVYVLRRSHHEQGIYEGGDEVELPVRIRSGYSSKTTEHDITIDKKD